jgi:hypothetical protein
VLLTVVVLVVLMVLLAWLGALAIVLWRCSLLL